MTWVPSSQPYFSRPFHNIPGLQRPSCRRHPCRLPRQHDGRTLLRGHRDACRLVSLLVSQWADLDTVSVCLSVVYGRKEAIAAVGRCVDI